MLSIPSKHILCRIRTGSYLQVNCVIKLRHTNKLYARLFSLESYKDLRIRSIYEIIIKYLATYTTAKPIVIGNNPLHCTLPRSLLFKGRRLTTDAC